MDYLPLQSVVKLLARRMNIAEADAARFFQSQAELALEHAEEGFTIPGIGVLRAMRRPAHELEVPAALRAEKGATVALPARTAITFRISSVVRHALLRRLTTLPDVTCGEVFNDLQDLDDRDADRAG